MATQQYKTPGVYIQEPNSFPPSIVGVDTAVPCFIGYTQFARDSDNRSLKLAAKRIESMAEYVQSFGQGYPEEYNLEIVPAGETDAQAEKAAVDATDKGNQNWGKITLDSQNIYRLIEVGESSFNLYNSMRLFFANGGGTCFVISCGSYQDEFSGTDMKAGLTVCAALIGPTMVAIPDAVLLTDQDQFNGVAAALLNMCGKAGDRMALLDVWGAEALRPRDDPEKVSKVIDDFRSGIKSQVPAEYLRFGAAYFPPVVTSVVAPDEIDISHFGQDKDKLKVLQNALRYVVGATYPAPKEKAIPKVAGATPGNEFVPEPAPAPPESAAADRGTSKKPVPAATDLSAKGKSVLAYVDRIGTSLPNDTIIAIEEQDKKVTHKQLTQALTATVPGFQKLLAAVAATQGVLPPSGAIAGVWTANDTLRGVWNAPANTGITTMIMPKIPISHEQQEDLNVPVQGLAVNAIRTFPGRGSLIWGARTLDSNSNDWRYIQVRRTMIYVEQSVKQALEAMVFKPNTAQTWVTVTAMIESFLHGLWAAGGLMGGSPNEAYNVQAGLGSTMTPQDVLEGVMRVHITLQMVHPAEFIELTFKQQMLGGA